MPFALDLRPIPEIVGRALTRRRRNRTIYDPMPVILQWRCRGWINQNEAPLLTEVGPVHLTLCAHENNRWMVLMATGWTGTRIYRNREIWRVTFIFFVFSLTFEWCHAPNTEKVDPLTLGKRF